MLTATPLVVGPDAGGQPRVKVYNAETGGLRHNFLAFESSFTGGVRVATGDVTGDGVADIIAGKGPGGGSQIRVFNGVTGNQLAGAVGSFQAYGAGQTDGVFVAAGDVNGDGRADIITGTEQGAAPVVKIFSGQDGSLIASFTVADAASVGGIRVAAGDVNGDGLADIITGEGPGGRPRVCVIDGGSGKEAFNFFAYSYEFGGGIYVSASDITGDGKADIVVGPGAGHTPEIRAFHGADTAHLSRFLAFDPSFTGGVRVGTVDADGDGRADIVAAAGAPGNQVKIFSGQNQSLLKSIKPYGNSFDDGLYAAGPTSTDGFTILSGDPAITILPFGPQASEPSTQSQFNFTRTEGPPGGISVNYSVSGIASNGVDYQTLSGTISVAVGSNPLYLIPIDDSASEGAETVIVTIQPGTGYTVGTPSSATITIADNEPGQGDYPTGAGPDQEICEEEKLEGLRPAPKKKKNPIRTFSGGPVRYFDGTIHFQNTDLASAGFGAMFGITRSWSNHAGYSTSSHGGSGTVIAELPYLRQNGTTILAISNGTTARYFDYNFMTSSYAPRYYLTEKLTHDTANKEFLYTDESGGRVYFHDFDFSLPANKQGQMKKFIDLGGNEISVTSYTTDNKPEEIQRSGGVGSDTIYESYLFTYLTSGTNAGEISNITQRTKVNSGGSWTTIRQVDYVWYDGTTSEGNAHDLKTATIKDSGGNPLDVYYYRYYKSGEANGYEGGLQYAFSPRSYDRLKAVYSDPATATDAQVAPYSDLYLEYNAAKLVTKETVQGDGACCGGTGGLGTYTFDYYVSGFADGHNTWSRKSVENLPDGNLNTIFTNFAGQVMLKSFKDVSSGNEWIEYFKYDSNGRLIWAANPSAVSGYDATKPDLVNNQSGNYQYLRDSEGLIEVTTYYTSTTATSTTAGGVAGEYEKTELKRGENGSAVLQARTDYFTRTAFSYTFPVTANSTVYRNTDGTGGETTSFAYTWHGSTAAVESVVVTLPTVTTSQNGPGSADTATMFFDTFGRATWSKDGDGFIHYVAYDMATSAVNKTIVDVNTANTGDFTNKPSGWTTPTGGGLHLITQFEVDLLGRATKVTSPAGNIDYIVYKDTAHEVRVYPGWDTTNNVTTGPTQVVREDRAGGYYETLTMSATPTVTSGRPTGGEAISSVETVSRQNTNNAWQVTSMDAYFNLSGLTYTSSTSYGTQDVNFYRTSLNYDSRGRLYKTTTPTGTIYQTDFDDLGRPSADKVGTSDANLVTTAAYVYDAGGIGDSNLTQFTVSPAGGAADRVQKFYYDWRNRLVATKSGHETTESISLNRPIVYFEFDNLGQTIAVEQYDGDTVTISDANSDGVPDKPSSSLLRARSTASFDEQGRLYRTNTFSVDQSNGNISSNSLATNIWYGRRGQVLKSSAPGGLVAKAEYDGAARASKRFLTDGGGDTAWTDADDVTGDAVLEQSENTYDADSNVIMVTLRQRFHDETATGALNNPTTAPKARVSYATAYYDKANRPTASVNVGTNAGSAYTRPSSVPSRSDTVLVSSQTYNSAGWVSIVTDPRGIESRLFYDNLGRTTKTIEAYADGTPDGGNDKTNEFTYDGGNHVLTLKAYLTGTTYQKTQWVYGVTTTTSGLNSNDLLAEMRYPDKTSGDASSTEKDIFTYDALGEVKTKQDRNGNVHTYSFDVVGRLTTDAVTTLGTNVDSTLRRAEIAYDTGGRPYLFTTYDASSGGNIVNQVQRDFNGLGQLTKEYQSHSGAVNTGTTPKVQYAYSEMAGAANHSRPTSLTYPSGRVLDYVYGSGLDTTISRLTSLSSNSTTLESLSYLGLATVVKRAHSEPGVDLTYIKQSGESNGDAGDQYTGLDRFGRVVDQRWIKTSDGSHTDRFKYGYDRDSNRLYRENAVNAAFSELYHANGASNGYDNSNQLVEFRRGTLSDTNSDNIPDTVATSSRYQVWTMDGQGNWGSLTTDGTSVSRTHNKQNQVTAVGAATLTFDSNGNLTTDEIGQQYVYDAWNRLVTIKNSGGTTIASYKNDALGRRIQETVSSTTTDSYFSAAWQVLEEQVSGTTKVQYVWSPVYIDALVLRDRDADGNGGNGLEERFYVQQDANFNVTAIISTLGVVIERYVYDAYGAVTYLSASWIGPADGYNWRMLYQGGLLVTITGLYHFRNRDLHPTLGRWIQPDPIGFTAGDPNLYRFVGNQPTGFVDPSGLDREAFREACRRNGVPNAYVDRLLQAIGDTSVWWGPNHCDRWCAQFLVVLQGNTIHVTSGCGGGIQSIRPVTWNDPLGILGMNHVTIEIIFANGTILYVDNGYLGGSSHIFLPSAIPCRWTPGAGWGIWGSIYNQGGLSPHYIPPGSY